ncbi:MAG: sigma-70 family RNA polymerase sigma factor [Deltaproteobacteria bacterium]|nr:sigma-70 family RNA polymerase sigma factor [Deltaproteobacteria bacterium]
MLNNASAGKVSQLSRREQLLNRELRPSSKVVAPTPGGHDPGVARIRSREERITAACKRMSQLLHNIAYRIARRLPTHIEVDELISAGSVGLVTAVRQHIDKPAIELERLVARRIRGAIMDHLRAADYLTRRQRAAVIAIQKTRDCLEREGQESDIAAVAKRLGLSTRRATQIHDRLMSVQFSSLEVTETTVALNSDPINDLIEREDYNILASAVSALPRRLKKLISLCYFEELSYRDVSITLGISRSRVCQLHAQAMHALRKHLQPAAV